MIYIGYILLQAHWVLVFEWRRGFEFYLYTHLYIDSGKVLTANTHFKTLTLMSPFAVEYMMVNWGRALSDTQTFGISDYKFTNTWIINIVWWVCCCVSCNLHVGVTLTNECKIIYMSLPRTLIFHGSIQLYNIISEICDSTYCGRVYQYVLQLTIIIFSQKSRCVYWTYVWTETCPWTETSPWRRIPALNFARRTRKR